MEKTRSGEYVSSQVADFAAMDLSSVDFSLAGGQKFQVKNEGTDAVTLDVIPASAVANTSISTKFDPGWNPAIVRQVKQNAASGLALKWGY